MDPELLVLTSSLSCLTTFPSFKPTETSAGGVHFLALTSANSLHLPTNFHNDFNSSFGSWRILKFAETNTQVLQFSTFEAHFVLSMSPRRIAQLFWLLYSRERWLSGGLEALNVKMLEITSLQNLKIPQMNKIVWLENKKVETTGSGTSFLAKLAIALGIAATITFISVGLKPSGPGSSIGIQCLAEGLSSPSVMASPTGFSFKAFGYKFVLPEYAPGWIYFWLIMAAGFGLFISEEALIIWVGISLARIRLLTLDGTWQSFVESFSRTSPYTLSTVLWVYWGVCISDTVPFYFGRLFRQSGASNDISSKLGIGKEKALSITRAVQKYGNLIGFVERFSLGVRNPTSFLAGTLGISPDYFFAGVCCGGLITLPLQLGIGFLMRERPVSALATVAIVVGIWTVFPYGHGVAASTALFLYLRRRYST